jgi:hypothetical protein
LRQPWKLTAKVELVVLETRILPGAARESDDGDNRLHSEKNHPEVHASLKACVLPRSGFWQTNENKWFSPFAADLSAVLKPARRALLGAAFQNGVRNC